MYLELLAEQGERGAKFVERGEGDVIDEGLEAVGHGYSLMTLVSTKE